MHEAAERDGQRHADGADDERAGHSHGKWLQADSLEHAEVRVQSDRRHRGAEQNLRRPEISKVFRDRRPRLGTQHAERRAGRSERRISDRAHQRHRQEANHEARHQSTSSRRRCRPIRFSSPAIGDASTSGSESPRREKCCASAWSPSPPAARRHRHTSVCRSAPRQRPGTCRERRCRGTGRWSRTSRGSSARGTGTATSRSNRTRRRWRRRRRLLARRRRLRAPSIQSRSRRRCSCRRRSACPAAAASQACD